MSQSVLRSTITASIFYCLCSVTFAVPFFGTTSTSSKSSPTPRTPPPSPVLSPDDFSARVNVLHQQTKASLTQQANEALPKKPASSASPATNTNLPSDANAGQTSLSPPLTNNDNTSHQEPTPAPAETYSGFGTGKTTSPPASTNTPPNNTGGWNIKY